jgi:hypothetical protein
MNARIFALTAAIAAAAALPAAASAAQIQADRPCYEDNTGQVAVSGNGFDPGQPYQVTLDGKTLSTGNEVTGPDGSVAGSIETPQLSGSSVHVYKLNVVQGANTASTTFSVTPFLADFTPGSGNPKTLRVRFKIFGFGLATANPVVYLHYVRPNGKLKRTIRLGKSHGACGQIERTARKKLFPFRAEAGRWRLQFDTQRKYRKAQPSQQRTYATIDVIVRQVFG